MKLVTFKAPHQQAQAGWIEGQTVYSIAECSGGNLPDTMSALIKLSVDNMRELQQLAGKQQNGFSINEVELLAPLEDPSSIRDFMAFEDHLLNASKKSGLTIHPEWYKIPVFYFTNHQSIHGPNQTIEIPPNCKMFDYELEIAAVIGKQGKNIKAAEADDYIFGYTIFNDWSARDLQMQEMQVGLGPAKGKDAATSIGPYIVTKDELESYRLHDRYDLKMTAKVNGKLLSTGNFKDIHYTFGEMIERASAGVTLYPGDVIGSGTVGTGCLLELGQDIHPWLQPGDEVELEITELGVLRNLIGE
ncbi:fumarylacetoacetate hydrolase family protein [Sporosarcina koreensis]|uniref:fumarylacetoacetate hydrolase family protein n=1 Tax=Sporosarcina koreensis TaxID=334735 RepID=UPI00075C2560|nr:fumarylacetoacetate hydrolase family protein [Sporosarcina koreensis]